MRRPSVGRAATSGLVVLDNLREGVLTPDIYDPILNPLYRDMLAIAPPPPRSIALTTAEAALASFAT